jgi:preprotein translocase subunit SecA
VESAIDAKFIYTNEHHYLIGKDNRGVSRITPIDYSNTGVIQNNTTWGDGLHQFLQIKEGLQTTPETLITNFLSNKAYFSRYENRIFGLTGTLGSKSAKKLLKSIYKVEFITVPRYKYSSFIK